MSEERVKTTEIGKDSIKLVENPKVCSFSIESLLAPSKNPVKKEICLSIQTETYLHECKCIQFLSHYALNQTRNSKIKFV